MKILSTRSSSFTVITVLISLMVLTQFLFFLLHYRANDLLDEFVQSALFTHFFHLSILLPLFMFIGIQIAVYGLWILLIWFMARASSEACRYKLSDYTFAIIYWIITTVLVFSLNRYFYPYSFFASFITNNRVNITLLVSSATLTLVGLTVTYFHVLHKKRYRVTGSLFIFVMGFLWGVPQAYPYLHPSISQKPNIIIIGLDSVRPDHIHYLNPRQDIQTPNIDKLLKESVVFNNAYTPLARTFPSWMTILTGQHPLHHHARHNLAALSDVHEQDNLAKRLQQQGYQTIYATDEKRFSNITSEYGFDQVWGPQMGVNDFILGSLSDFPLTNLLINLPAGRLLFPYNYANRAAAITYEPNTFLQQVAKGISNLERKPVFLAIHFCVTHWPFTWSHSNEKSTRLSERYRNSVEKVDQELGLFLNLLKKNGLLDNSVIILLSDHGTTIGLPHDRIIEENHYRGTQEKLKWLTVNLLSDEENKEGHYQINTSYGQGTDILSLKQNHVVLAFKGFGKNSNPKTTPIVSSLMDIAPTLLDYLHLKPLNESDGLSLLPFFISNKSVARTLFLETEYTTEALLTENIQINKVLKENIRLYDIDPKNGFLYVEPKNETRLLASKERAVLLGDWLLAYYPQCIRQTLKAKNHGKTTIENFTQPAYFVLVNIKTGEWNMGLKPSVLPNAPIAELSQALNRFYGEEIPVLR